MAGTNFPFIRRVDPDALPRVTIAGRTYLIEGKIGSGDKCGVFRGAWDNTLTERVVIKIGAEEIAPALARETSTISVLGRSSANGTPFFAKLLPEVVGSGSCTWQGASRAAIVYRYKNRFDWTIADAIKEYPDGVDPKAMVWMWKRALTPIAWLQLAGWSHSAITPGHMLIHPLNHGMTFIDWAYAVRIGQPQSIAESWDEAFLPGELTRKEPTTTETDIAMSARCMIAVLGGDPADGTLPSSVPGPIAEIVRVHARYDESAKRIEDALALEKEFGRVASEVFGPSKYIPFEMPRKS